MSAADAAVSAAEAKTLFGPLARTSALILAVSGGPDSTALLLLAARWRRGLKRGPKLVAVTVDHGLRSAAAAEARAVGRLARALGVSHRTLRWRGRKPRTGLQKRAREERYRLLAAAARSAKAGHILTAHTLDDQAETVLMRMSRGSGLAGLGAMAKVAPLPAAFSEKVAAGVPQKTRPKKKPAGGAGRDILLVRPLLDIPKARLVATLARARIPFADDPTNRDPRFTRARLRDLMPALAREGLDAKRFALLAHRLRRADAAVEAAVDAAAAAASWSDRGPILVSAKKFAGLPEEVALRLLGRAIARAGGGLPFQLGKLETLARALRNSRKFVPLRRTLGGALVTLTAENLAVERAPARRAP